MQNLAIRQADMPTCSKTGLTLPLSTSLGSQDLAKHRAMVAVELEVMAYKVDRFGWDRSRGTATHDRMITDWMDALQDYPLAEIQAGCRAALIANPNRMPNEGHVIAQINKARAKTVAAFKASLPPAVEPQRANRVTAEQAAKYIKRAGIALHVSAPKGGDA